MPVKKEKAWDSHSRKGKSCRRQASQAQIKALTPKLEAPYGKFYIYIYIYIYILKVYSDQIYM
jgi:hypothetical protein